MTSISTFLCNFIFITSYLIWFIFISSIFFISVNFQSSISPSSEKCNKYTPLRLNSCFSVSSINYIFWLPTFVRIFFTLNLLINFDLFQNLHIYPFLVLKISFNKIGFIQLQWIHWTFYIAVSLINLNYSYIKNYILIGH